MRLATVRIGAQHFAIELDRVREFLPPQFPTTAPLAPEPVMGILNLRGDILTAYEVAPRLGAQPHRLPEGPYYMVAFGRNGVAAVAVDLPGDVYEWHEDHLSPTPPAMRAARADYFKGVFDTELGVVPWLNLDTLINPVSHS